MMKVTRWNSRVPSECFAYHKRPFWPVLCLKRTGLPCCTFVTVTVTCSLQIILLSNYSLLTISALVDTTLLKTNCHFLLLLVGFDTPTVATRSQWIEVSVLKCHPWIGIADTHNTRGIITEFSHTLITSSVSYGELITIIWLKAI